MHTIAPFVLAGVLTGTGVFALLTKRTLIGMVLGVQLLLAAAVLIVISAERLWWVQGLSGDAIAVLLILIGAVQVVVVCGVHLLAASASASASASTAASTPAPEDGEEDQ